MNTRLAGRLLCVLAPLWLGLAACSGDARPLTEAIEAEELDLASLIVSPPEGSIEPLFVAGGETVVMQLTGRDSGGSEVTVDASERRWRVSNSAVASISDSGVLRAREPGTTQVTVQIAGIVAEAYEITVSNAPLSAIERIDGPDEVDRCLAGDYSAVGVFDDGSLRRLSDVVWSVPENTGARVVTAEDGRTQLVASQVGALNLTAASGDQQLGRNITVADTLTSLAITPTTLAVRVDRTLALGAVGTYNTGADVDAAERTETITANVDWQIVTGESFASVSNATADRGLLSGVSAGAASVQAACGDVQSTRDVVVSESAGDGGTADGLVFEDDDISLRIGATVQLQVSTGSTYDPDLDVTSGTTFTIIGVDGQNVVSLSDTRRGLVTGLRSGDATIRATDTDNRSATVEITVR